MSIRTIEPAYHPNQKMSFLVDWLVTLKCNYDCAYCPIGPTGHDNSTKHPPVEQSLMMLDQMYEYVDVIMSHKKNASKEVIMQMLGGEVIYHPNVIELMKHSSERYQPYKDKWRLKRRLTTNGTASEKIWTAICDHIEGITMSYHSTGPDKLKKLFKNNIEYLSDIKKEHDLIVCMYPDKLHWRDCVDFLQWAKDKGLNARPKILDGPLGVYTEEHLKDLSEFINPEELKEWDINKRGLEQARGCCGGRKMCFDRQLKKHQTLVPRGIEGFRGWHCSANQFFLHGNNVTGNYYTNKDCRVRLDGTTGAIADTTSMSSYIDEMRKQQVLPTLVCAQSECACGTCAPKSVAKKDLIDILKIYNKPSPADTVEAR